MCDAEETGTMEVDEGHSDSSDSGDEESALEENAKKLESQISAYAYNYDAHLELVGVYKKLMNLTAIRKTYERFHEYFPLTASLWLEWIKDEIRVANSENEKQYVISLFDKAVEDYLSVDLWLEYVQFGVGYDNTDDARKLFERAITAAGLHVAKGSLIWDAYREFELAHLSCIPDSDSDVWEQQAKRTAEVFRRQISVTLLDMDRTFVEWRVWYEKLPRKEFVDAKQVEWAYKKSTKYIDDYREFEERLLAENEDHLKVYREYIRYEPTPEIIRVLFERALAEFSLDAELWMDYCMYFFKLGNYPSCFTTVERALRNCPWNENLWVFYMRSHELIGKNHDAITTCLEKALQSGFQSGDQYLQIWLAYMEHYRRITNVADEKSVEKFRAAFQKSLEHILSVDGDSECTLLRLWAKIEVSFLKNMTEARKVWNDYGILKRHGDKANYWLELIDLERNYGDEKHVRKTYQRALTSTKDWPQCIVQSWTMYERECGSVESIISCMNMCSAYMKKFEVCNPSTNRQEKPGISNDYVNHDEIKKDKTKKRQHEPERLYHKTKYGKVDKKPQKEIRREKNEKISDEEMAEEKPKAERIDINDEKQKRSVFISNLDYAVTEDELKNFLGQVEELRLVKDRKGHSKGYAYVVFATNEEAEKALSRDRERLENRPVFISKCKMDRMQREPQFRYSTETEKHKLFIRGLPLSMTQEEVEALFKVHGELKEVRLVTYRNGRSKGLAYVEFVNANDAAKAILVTDNSDVQGYTISVAISAPPKRKQNEETILAEPSRHSTSRLQMPLLVPRAVQISSTKPAAATLTNEDFRKMLLSEK